MSQLDSYDLANLRAALSKAEGLFSEKYLEELQRKIQLAEKMPGCVSVKLGREIQGEVKKWAVCCEQVGGRGIKCTLYE